MCGICQAEYDSYKTLYDELNTAKEKVEQTQQSMKDIQSNFENVEIAGEKVGEEELNNCINNFTVVASQLRTTAENCMKMMTQIRSMCPGPDHFDNEDTKYLIN